MPHIKVLHKSQMELRVQDTLVDRVGRFVHMLVSTRDEKKRKVSFQGFDFEYHAGEREVIFVKEEKKVYLKLSRPKGSTSWSLDASAEGVLDRIGTLHMSWKQKFDLENFRAAHVRKKTGASGQTALA